jgi:uncharacterized protein (TIGR03083 family)
LTVGIVGATLSTSTSEADMSTSPTTTATAMTHTDWMTAAAEEYRRLDELLAGLGEADWGRPTDCAGWTVHDVVAHLAGAAESNARTRELLRQWWLGRRARPGAPSVDGMNEVQVRERSGATPADLRSTLADAGARGVRARTRLPAFARAVRLPFGPPLGTRPLGYLMDRIYTRDAWMHRVDISRATGRPLLLTAEHDGRIVADVVAEWARSHGQPYRLVLTGPAGGAWSAGVDGEEHTLDAVEFARIVSGRQAATGLLAHAVPF